ncbi:MAG: DUF4406 domain-containing protein [Hespellia sp.]|nr:DUF4406 domain-containing protein [Hespellia sp.]
MGVSYFNQEGYGDPVPFMAIKAMEQNEKKNMFRPVVYICSPFAGDMDGNTAKARRYSRFAVDKGAIPIAPHLLLPQFMSEETERELAMFMNMVLLTKCLELWVFGSLVSEGMQAEIDKAKQRNMIIRYFTEELEETDATNNL